MGLLTKLFGGNNASVNDEYEAIIRQCIREAINEHGYLYKISFVNIPAYQDAVPGWTAEKKFDFLIYLADIIDHSTLTEDYFNPLEERSQRDYLARQCLPHVLRAKTDFEPEHLSKLLEVFRKNKFSRYQFFIIHWPIGSLLGQIEHFVKRTGQLSAVSDTIRKMRQELGMVKDTRYTKDINKYLDRIKALEHGNSDRSEEVMPVYFSGADGFRDPANELLKRQSDKDLPHWYQLLAMAQKSSGSKPTKKFLDEAKAVVKELGADKFKKLTHEWFERVIELKESQVIIQSVSQNHTYEYPAIEFLNPHNMDCLKGLVWMSSQFHDNKTIHTLGRLAERCFRKIPSKGQAAAAIGNACLYSLYASKGLDGISQLSRLKVKVKQNSTLVLIEKYLETAAADMGITAAEIEDLSVDDFRLQNDKRVYEFEGYRCELQLTGIGKSELKWFRENGEAQKTVPATVKEKYAAKLKKLKETQKQLDQMCSAQKERFDRMLRSNRVMTTDYLSEKYLQHPLLSFVTRKIIFTFMDGKKTKNAIQLEGVWTCADEQTIDISQYKEVMLWHPVNSGTEEVRQWRDFLIRHQIQQPFKQAFREIYLLTDAELNTRTYSNRMASHILKQHQYVTLAKGRQWHATLIGSWDYGSGNTAWVNLPEFNLRAEFWVNEVNAENQMNDTGIWNYVSTDQIRFINTYNDQLMELIDVPRVAFSEVLRDIDLFVGVASVGNDPTWRDSGGLPVYRDYWQSYSFGDLSELARSRKEILTTLIPRLKIASVTSIQDKFVVVKGKLRTYKIHIGSTNILMEPNDQYLCIVPDRSKDTLSEKVFLPFEGDSGLSVIISKAMLLAEDDKITDTSITSQINR